MTKDTDAIHASAMLGSWASRVAPHSELTGAAVVLGTHRGLLMCEVDDLERTQAARVAIQALQG